MLRLGFWGVCVCEGGSTVEGCMRIPLKSPCLTRLGSAGPPCLKTLFEIHIKNKLVMQRNKHPCTIITSGIVIEKN